MGSEMCIRDRNIFDLLDDKKYAVMAAEAEELKQAMRQIEEALQ